MDKLKTSGENFYKIIGSNRSELRQSQSNFYFSSNKSETFSTLIQMLKSDLLTIQDMINSNINDIKMYKLLSKNPNLTKKLSEIEESKNISFFIDKITEQSANIEKVSKIYGTQSSNECIQKLFLECYLNDLFMKKVSDYFTLMKLKLYNDDTYQESLSKIIFIREFIEKIPNKNNVNENVNFDKKKKSEIDDFLKINTLKELLDYNSKNKKICTHIFQLVENYFNDINNNIIKTINKFDIENNLNFLADFKGTQVEKYFKLKETYNKILSNYNSKYENLLSKVKNKENLDNEINLLNEKYEKEIIELNNKLDKLLKENENLKNSINSNSDLKYTSDNINTLKEKNLDEKKKLEESYKKKIETLKTDLKNLKEKILEVEKKIKDKENIKDNEPKKDTLVSLKIDKIEKIDIKEFIKKHDIEYSKNIKEANKKFDNEINDLNLKVDQITEKINILKLEKSDLKKKLEIIQGRNFNKDTYEKILLKQFDFMKEAFSKKVNELNNQINFVQNDSRKKTFELEQDFKEINRLKNVFQQQIITLINQIDN